MSTRATYLFKGSRSAFVPTNCFYIHYDGYESGAAFYFWNAVAHPNKRSGLAGQFFRANELAEFTPSHDSHGDTEYRYVVDGLNVMVQKRVGDWSKPEWAICYHGPLAAFINKNAGEWFKPDTFSPVIEYQGALHTVADLQKRADEQLAYAKQATEKGWTGNAASAESEAKRLLDAINQKEAA
jgi:hypothetical protein